MMPRTTVSFLLLLLLIVPFTDSSGNIEERYSRQTFTLGARAQGIVRSDQTVLILDGNGGLSYEIAKNAALMGIRNILVLEEQENDETTIQDDLGNMAVRGSSSLVEQLRSMNPTISVHTGISKTVWKTAQSYDNAVYVAADKTNALKMAAKARKHRIKCIVAETFGVFGRIMCDLGDSHTVVDPDGETPLLVPLDTIVPEHDTIVMIHAVDGEKHDVSKGDIVQFRAASGTVVASCTVQEVLTPFRFRASVEDPPAFLSNVKDSTTFQRVKTPVELKYHSLRSAIEMAKRNDDTIFTPCDLLKSFDTKRRNTIMEAFAAVKKCTQKNDFVTTVQKSIPDLDDSLLTAFWRGRNVKFAPMQSILGAIVTQEAIKALTGVYTPIQQILLYDVDEVLPEGEPLNTDKVSSSGLRTLLGDSVVDQLEDTKVFVVGAGAIGCELLKNLAAMRVGARGGKVVVTDMDTIEASNLSRQLLFRESDLGKFKSLAAKEAIERLEPAMNVEAHSSKVGVGSSSPFDESFWSNLDIVLNALDNVEARLYMDAQCVTHRKALVDAGTMGPKGNVQVVVPHQSESYASSADPPEPAIPVCTIKNFPYAISHTIQWGKELFEEHFQRRPVQANRVMDELEQKDYKDVVRTIYQGTGAERATEITIGAAQDIKAMVNAKDLSVAKSEALKWATTLARRLFYEASEKLLDEHPLDSKDEDGESFWSGTRRAPKLLRFERDPTTTEQEAINQNLVEFIRFATRIRFEVLTGNRSDAEGIVEHESVVAALMESWTESVSTPSDINNKTTPSNVMKVFSSLDRREKRLDPIDFEKDDDFNGHVAFIAASSNLRAIAYGIPAVSVDETRRVAGKIIPAMVTTTALVSGLSCIELIKVAQAKQLKKHRNAFVNLALPFFAFTSPVPADAMPGLQGRSYTLWDRIIIREGPISNSKGGISMKHVLKTIKEKVANNVSSVDVASISFGPYMIYANFLHDDDSEFPRQKLWPLLRDVLAEDNDTGYDSDAPFVDLDVVVEDTETGEAVELPPVRIYRFVEA